MKFDLKKDLLQKDIPSGKWLTKDDQPEIIRAVSKPVDVNNMTADKELTMQKLIDAVRYSQDPILNQHDSPDFIRPAVGLAANQIGKNYNMFFARFEWPDRDPEEIAAINPKILSKSVQTIVIEEGEGCLSVDQDREGVVPRSYKIVVEYYDYLKKQNIHETLRGYKAIVFQHEFGHLQGQLYYDLINKKDPKHVEDDWLVL